MAETSPRADLPRFQQVQYAFAAHLRDPDNQPAPGGLEERRLKIYRELFYNNVEGFIGNAFPVLRKLMSDTAWHALVRDFYARHQSREPEFHRLAEEFLRFVQEERGAVEGDLPFMSDLAHYEWVELALGLSTAELTPELANPNGDLMEGCPVISPLAWALSYDYPVQHICPDMQPTEPGPTPTYVVVYRTRQDEVKFMEINAVSARLMQLIEENPQASGRTLLLQIAEELQHPEPAVIVEAGRGMLAGLRERDIVLGTRHD